MKITDLTIDGFGVWTDLEAPELSSELNVFYGPNEAGKTTLLQFVRAMFYGFTAGRKQRYLPPVRGGRPGGLISVATLDGRYRLARHLDHLEGEEHVALSATDGSVLSSRVLPSMLGNVDEATFRNVFAVGLREIQELATLGDGDVARLLYDITAGLDRVSLIDVIRELATSRERLLATTGNKPSQVTELLARREKLIAQCEELSGLGQRFARLTTTQAEQAAEIKQLEADSVRLDAEIRLAEVASLVNPRWTERDLLQSQLEALGPLGEITAESIGQLDALDEKLGKYRRHLRKLRLASQSLTAQSTSLGINEALWSQAARIEALSEHEPWITATERTASQVEAEVIELDKRIAADRAKLALPKETTLEKIVKINAATMESLRGPAKALRAAKARLIESKSQIGDNRAAAESLSEQIDGALASTGQGELIEAIESKGSLISQLRRRIQVDDRLEQLGRQYRALEIENQELLEQQFLPPWMLVGLGSAFVVGMGMLLGGLFLPASLISGGTGLGLAVLGIMAMIVAGMFKHQIEESLASQHQACEKQLNMLRLQVTQATDERDLLEKQLPKGGGPLDVRLNKAEEELSRLEELLPLDARRQAAAGESQAAKQLVQHASQEVATARKRWAQALEKAGFPANLTPKKAHQLAVRCEALGELYRQAQRAREQAAQQRRELATIGERIAQLMTDGKVEPDNDGLINRLRQLRRIVAQQQELVTRRTALRKELRAHRLKSAKLDRARRSLERRRRELLASAGAVDEDDFRRRAARRLKADGILREQQQLNGEIAAMLAGQATEEDIRALYDLHPGAQLKEHRSGLGHERAGTMDNLRRLYHDHGQASAQLQAMAEDRRPQLLRWELGIVEEQLVESISRWQVLATTSVLLEEVRKLYEHQRQPQTLMEASKYLASLTKGQYRRVWTPLSEQVLRVEDAQGRSLPVEVLSRGTREQLFLALRLALVHAYSRRGIALPLVLDDVLVNFDVGRAVAAASVLRDFAKAGHQLLIFTCHEHILEIFAAVDAQIRRLPPNALPHQRLLPDEAAIPVEAAPVLEKPKRRPKPLLEPVILPDPPVEIVDEPALELEPEPEPTPPVIPTLVIPTIMVSKPAAIELPQASLPEPEPPVAEEPEEEPAPPPPVVAVKPEAKRKRRRVDTAQERPRIEPPRKKRERPTSVEPIRWSAEEFDGELEDRVNRAAIEVAGPAVDTDESWEPGLVTVNGYAMVAGANGEHREEAAAQE